MKLTEEKLVTTEKEVIIYGEFNSENDELFRCPKATAHEDLRNFINRNRMLIVPMRDGNYSIPFVDDETKNLREVEGLNMVGYWRMYYDGGHWCGKWFFEGKEKPDWYDTGGVQRIINWIEAKFDKGCDYYMKDFCEENFTKVGDQRYLIRPYLSENYKIMIDTTYGNHDYPVRIYTYHKDKQFEYYNKDLVDLLRTKDYEEFLTGMTIEEVVEEKNRIFEDYNKHGVFIDWDRIADLNYTKEVLDTMEAEPEEDIAPEVVPEPALRSENVKDQLEEVRQMNGFQLMADACRKAADKGKISRLKTEKKCKVYDFLATCDREDINNLFDSGVFNDITKAYLNFTLGELREDGDIRKKDAEIIEEKFGKIFDGSNAEDIVLMDKNSRWHKTEKTEDKNKTM